MTISLMYHDIVTLSDKSSGFQNESAFQYKVEEASFDMQVKALKEDKVVFTFDDGGESFYTKAAPILEKYGKKGVFFISTAYLDSPGFLTKQQLKSLVEHGHVVGSHSHTHPENFTKLSKEDIRSEWSVSYNILKEILGTTGIPASIPNGYASKVVLDEAIGCGYTDIYTSQPTTKVKMYKQHRIIGRYVVHDNMSIKDVKTLIRNKNTRLMMSIKWHCLNVIKVILGSSYDTIKAKVLR